MVKILVRYWPRIRSKYVYMRIVTSPLPAADSQIVQHCNLNLTVICVWIAECERLLLTVKKMSGQVRWKGRFIKNKTLEYEVCRNSGLVEARKRKYSAGNFTYASKLVVCVCVCVSKPTAGQAEEMEQCCRVYVLMFLIRLSINLHGGEIWCFFQKTIFKEHKYRHFINFSTRAFNYYKLKCGVPMHCPRITC